MLKRTIGLLLTIALIQHVAYVPVTYAASADIVISHIQPGLPGAATKEFIAIFNNGQDEVEISDWCLRNKAAIAFACFTPASFGDQYWLPAGAFAVVASEAYAQTLPAGVTSTITYVPTSQSSGSLVGSTDTLELVSADGEIIDQFGWTKSLASGALFTRKTSTVSPLSYLTGDNWGTMPLSDPVPTDQVEHRIVDIPDLCSNIDGLQAGNELLLVFNQDGTCIESIPDRPSLRITELLPNPAGVDAGEEYIELYNYGDEPIDLVGYSIQYGAAGEKSVVLPSLVVKSKSYVVITDAVASFLLPNASGVVRLSNPDAVLVDESAQYTAAKDNQAWALLEDTTWAYTKYLSPGFSNIEPMLTKSVAKVTATTPKPCAANQYRHPETNRCRLLAATVVQAACKAGQYRSVQTGRCRNTATPAMVTPCKAGQERNPETNRCRTIRSLSATNYDVLKAEAKSTPNPWYIYAAIGVVTAGLLGYAIWEWRVECKRFLHRLRWSVLRR